MGRSYLLLERPRGPPWLWMVTMTHPLHGSWVVDLPTVTPANYEPLGKAWPYRPGGDPALALRDVRSRSALETDPDGLYQGGERVRGSEGLAALSRRLPHAGV